MYKPALLFSDKVWWLVFGLPIIFFGLLALALLLPGAQTSACAPTSTPSSSTTNFYDSPNAVTSSMSRATDNFLATVASAEQTTSCAGKTVAAAVSRSGSIIADGMSTGFAFIGQALNSSATFMAHAVSSSIAWMLYIPNSVLGFAADTALVSAVIKPAAVTPSPIIEPFLPAATVAHAAPIAATASSQAAAVPQSAPVWPMRGDITTRFGVPHWPFQPVHTGIDISDGHAPGVTPIKPFKPGRVVDSVYSYRGLGNHVIVDHGEGITSVYAHLSSISTHIGQAVDQGTVLGYQGSTGTSTGTHLHFEIRIHGQPVDPRRFITNLP